MQLVGVILVLISIGTIVAPIGAVVVMYRDNLPQIVIPAEISDLINGNGTSIFNTHSLDSGNFTSEQDNFLAPVFVSSEVNRVDRTFDIVVNFTNTFTFNFTLNSLTAGVECTEHSYLLGNVSVNGPLTLPSGETVQIHVAGSWTQDAENHVIAQHSDANSINVKLVDLTINVSGIIIHQTEPVEIGEISFIQ